MQITLKKIILAVIVIALAVFLFKTIGWIVFAASTMLIIALRWVFKGLVIVGALFLLYVIFKK